MGSYRYSELLLVMMRVTVMNVLTEHFIDVCHMS